MQKTVILPEQDHSVWCLLNDQFSRWNLGFFARKKKKSWWSCRLISLRCLGVSLERNRDNAHSIIDKQWLLWCKWYFVHFSHFNYKFATLWHICIKGLSIKLNIYFLKIIQKLITSQINLIIYRWSYFLKERKKHCLWRGTFMKMV